MCFKISYGLQELSIRKNGENIFFFSVVAASAQAPAPAPASPETPQNVRDFLRSLGR